MTAPALDLARSTPRRTGLAQDGTGRSTSTRPVRSGTAGRPRGDASRPMSARSATPLARPNSGNRAANKVTGPRIRLAVDSPARACRGESAPAAARRPAQRVAAPAVQAGWQFTDRALGLIIAVVMTVLLAAAVALVHTAVTVTSADPVSAPAVATVAGSDDAGT